MATEDHVAQLAKFHEFFKGRCEQLFMHFGMEAVDLNNAAISHDVTRLQADDTEGGEP